VTNKKYPYRFHNGCLGQEVPSELRAGIPQLFCDLGFYLKKRSMNSSENLPDVAVKN
jgi:hypothetical protein